MLQVPHIVRVGIISSIPVCFRLAVFHLMLVYTIVRALWWGRIRMFRNGLVCFGFLRQKPDFRLPVACMTNITHRTHTGATWNLASTLGDAGATSKLYCESCAFQWARNAPLCLIIEIWTHAWSPRFVEGLRCELYNAWTRLSTFIFPPHGNQCR